MPKTYYSFDPRGYATVAERVGLAYEQFPDGRINTELVDRNEVEITFKALLYRYGVVSVPAATGWASERLGDGDINSVACLENTETSAIGRALANLGFLASTKRPSREEMEKAERARRRLTLAPRTQGQSEALQLRAERADEFLALLATAESNGFPTARARVLATHVNRMPGLSATRLRKLSATLRRWLRRRTEHSG